MFSIMIVCKITILLLMSIDITTASIPCPDTGEFYLSIDILSIPITLGNPSACLFHCRNISPKQR